MARILLTVTRVEDSISPGRVPLHPELVVHEWLALESGCKLNLALLEILGDVSNLSFNVELVVLLKDLELVLLHHLQDGLLEAINPVVQVTEE